VHAQRIDNPSIVGRIQRSRTYRFSPDESFRAIAAYAWPGNVRELENVIERAVTLGVSPYIQPEDLPKAITSGTAGPAEGTLWEEELNAAKKSIIERALEKTNGSRNGGRPPPRLQSKVLRPPL